jgi:hypothetical protein
MSSQSGVLPLRGGGLEELRDQLVALTRRREQSCVLSEPGHGVTSLCVEPFGDRVRRVRDLEDSM